MKPLLSFVIPLLGAAALLLAAKCQQVQENAPDQHQHQHLHQTNSKQQQFIDSQQHADTDDEYLVGVGIADITGPAADINLMGYAKPNQDAGGIHLRQFSRSIIVEDRLGNRIVYSNLDNGMVSQLLRTRVLERLRQQFGESTYNESNVMLSATHTHSAPGGFFQYMLYNIPSAGSISQTLDALVDGTVRSIERAHRDMQVARIYYTRGDLLDASINRSPISYANNPAEERARYKHDTDKEMFLLRFVSKVSGEPIAMLNWFAVHGTSMNNTNHLISSDNKGYAALLFEQEFQKSADTLPGRGKFVAIFAQANEGDVSPNTRGPRCIDTGLPCDSVTSTCGNPPRNEKCIAFGPGKDMFESTKIIAYKQYQKALQLFRDTRNQKLVRGPVKFTHQHIDITKQEVPIYSSVVELSRRQQLLTPAQPANGDRRASASRRQIKEHNKSKQIQRELNSQMQNNSTYRTCVAGLGYSFAAGTTDGPGAFDFQQGDTASGRYWNMVRDFLKKPSAEQTRCHYPKPILLSTGEMDFPYMWHPKVIPTQILMLGQVAIVGLPGEFTTMSGRRVREAVESALSHNSATDVGGDADDDMDDKDELEEPEDLNSEEARLRTLREAAAAAQVPRKRTKKQYQRPTQNVEVVLSGLSNIYSSYITTFEEYHIQRYEGASTLYGPHTLQAYINQFVRLAQRLVRSDPGPRPDPIQPPDLSKSLFTLKAGVIFDGAPSGKPFGSVLVDADTKRTYRCQDQVGVSFVAGNPRNDLRQESSFLYVDKFDEKRSIWQPIASDASWDTKFIWERTNTFFGESQAIIQWDIPIDCSPGVYRIRHYGAHKSLLTQSIGQYAGRSSPFKVAGGSSFAAANSTAADTNLNLDQLQQAAVQVELANNLQPQAAENQPMSQSKIDLAVGASERNPKQQPAGLFGWISGIFHWRGFA